MYNQNMPGQNIRGNMPPGARPMGNQYIRNAQPMIFRPNMQRMPAHMMNQNMLGMRGQMHPGFNPNQPGAPPGHPAQNMPGHPNPNMPNAPNLGHHNNLPNQGHFGNNLPHPQNNMPNNNNNSSAGNAGASGNLPNNPLKRRNGDRNLPDDIAVLIPESKSYKSLLAIENKIDKQISWKRLEIQETLKKPLKTRRKLRVFITTQYTPGKRINAPNLDAAGNNQQQKNEPGSWELRVEGKLADKKGIDHNKKRKFSSFFESLVIELDKEIYGPEQHLVEWHREKQNNETDGFQVKRPGDKDVRCTMLFMMHHSPEKCKLDIQLGKLLGIYIGTRAEILYNLWAYIRNNKLQDPNQKDVINLDPYLIRIFQVTQMRFSEIPHRIQQFMHKPDPMAIHHRIKCDVNDPKKTAIYDLDVDIDDIGSGGFTENHKIYS